MVAARGRGALTFQKTHSVPSFPPFFSISLGLHTFCSWFDLFLSLIFFFKLVCEGRVEVGRSRRVPGFP